MKSLHKDVYSSFFLVAKILEEPLMSINRGLVKQMLQITDIISSFTVTVVEKIMHGRIWN